MKCVFRLFRDGLFKCDKCGYVTKYGNADRDCVYIHQPEYEPTGPNLIRRILNFATSAIKHELTGHKCVTEDVLKARLEICQNCPSHLYKRLDEHNGVCTHESCGCSIRDYETYLNKIAWAEQRCPIGHWESIANSGNVI